MRRPRLAGPGLAQAALFGALALVAACNTYDPNLGASPFRCGDTEPRCPLDYTCVVYSSDQQICEKSAATPADASPGGSGDGSSITCADDSEVEPNDTISAPTNTFIPSLHSEYKLVDLAICPSTDADVFLFKVDVTGKNVRADVTCDTAGPNLAVSVLNSDGTSIRDGLPVDGMPGLVRADVANLPSGDYYVRVSSANDGDENNYSIDIALTGP